MPQSWIPLQVPLLQPGDPREAPAPTARQTASEEPSGGGHGEETPEMSSRLLFLTCLFGRHNNGQLCRGWMGTGGSSAQRGTARHTGAAGNPRGPARTAQPRPTPSIFQLHPAAAQRMLSPKNLPPPSVRPHGPELQKTSRHPKRRGENPGTEETPLVARSRPHSWHGHRLSFALSNLGAARARRAGACGASGPNLILPSPAISCGKGCGGMR